MVKEGILEKQFCGMLSTSWKARKCKLIGQKLFYYIPGKESQIRGVIDFDLLSCGLQVQEDALIFRILILMSEKKFVFKASSKEEMRDWIYKLQKQIVLSKGHAKCLTRLAIQPKFWRKDRISEKALMQTANTGDLVLFRTYGFLAKVQRFFTCSAVGI